MINSTPLVTLLITDLVFYYENSAFFLDIIRRDETFSEHGFQVSGVRLALAFSLLIPET